MGVAGGHREIWRKLIESKPADFARLAGLAVCCFAGQDLTKIGRGNPVLVFAGEAVVGDAKQGVKRYFHADLPASFADGTLLESFEEVDFTADDAPAAGLRRELAERQEHAALVVGQKNADANSGLRSFGHRPVNE